MTTFTMQDLTPTDTPTPEEDEAWARMEAEMAQAHAEDNKVIQGATGAQYGVVDLNSFHKPLEEIRADFAKQNQFQTTQQQPHITIDPPEPEPNPINVLLVDLAITIKKLITAIAEQKQPV